MKFAITRRELLKSTGISAVGGAVLPPKLFAQENPVRSSGIDISSWSGDIDWNKVLLNLKPRFVFARAYHMEADDSHSYEDEKFAKDYWPALQRIKMPRGTYIRCHPKRSVDQLIRALFKAYTPQPGDIVPSLDIEEDYENGHGISQKDRVNQIKSLVDQVSLRIGGQKPMLYTKAHVWGDLGNPSQFVDCPLWVIDYKSKTNPELPIPWTSFAFWQYGENIKPKDNGLEDYDPDYFNGPEDRMKAYFIRKVTPQPLPK